VADDNIDSAETLSMLLEEMGNEVSTAHNGLEAFERAVAFRPDVLVLDIGMPKLNGYEVARKIRAEEWGTQVVLIALTGWGQADDRRKSQDAGFDHHLVKPVTPEALEGILAKVQPRARGRGSDAVAAT
jgi:CheY-like chemotaxis protein